MARKRKEFHVYRRDNGVYYIRLPNGRSYQHKSLGATNERDAYKEAEALIAARKTGAGDGSETFSEAAKKYAVDHFDTLTERSAERYASSFNMLEPHIGHMKLSDISKADLQAYVTARRKSGVTDRTIRRDLMFVSSVYRQARVWEWTDRNPVSAFLELQRPKSGLKRRVKKTRFLSPVEEASLERAAAEYLAQDVRPSQCHERLMTVAAVFVSIDQGMRLGELVAGRRDHVDRGRGTRGEIFVPRAEGADDDGPVKSEARTLPLTARSREWIDRLPVHPEAPWLFWHGRGHQYGKFQTAFKALLELAGIKGFTWHDLRRTCGCRLLQDKGWRMEEVSKFLGHSSVEVTEQHYAFLQAEHLHSAMKRSEGA